MNRILTLVLPVLWAVAPGAWAASPIYVAADVPTDETASGTTILSSQAVLYDGIVPAYAVALTVPGDPTIDAIHKMDGPGDWLFSVESPSSLAGALASDAEPRDVVRHDGDSGTYSLCLSGAAAGIPADVDVDAVYLEGGDTGDLIVSFDVPTDLGGLPTFDPADLVRFVPTGPGVCAGWALAAANPAFDASAAGLGIPTSSNVIAADLAGGVLVLSFDVPTDVGPPGVVTYTPGQLVSWDGASFALFEPLLGWPMSSEVDGVSGLAAAGTVPPTLLVGKSSLTPGDLTLSWDTSCADGATDYGIYEGVIGSWYTHASVDCTDDLADRTEEVTPAVASTYYLVVGHNPFEEGSYGTATGLGERPVGTGACATPQIVAACPP